MKKLLLLTVISLFAFGLVLNGTAKAEPEGTLRVAMADFSYETVDPINFVSRWSWALDDALISHDPKGNIIGEIAESYTISPDGNTWVFKIRKGVKFHNGDPLTAHDVAFSVKRFG